MVPWWAWLLVVVAGAGMAIIDLSVAGRRNEAMAFRESLAWSIAWFVVGVAFAVPVWMFLGAERGAEYIAGYLIERSLSLDNVFVFALIFTAFAVPHAARQKALMWGIVGALVLRLILIFAGIALIHAFSWVMIVFGVFLIFTGAKMALTKQEEVDLRRNRTLKVFRRLVPMSGTYDGSRLMSKINGRRVATPLAAVFAVIATTDLVFALDSIPAIFAITVDPFVVVAANVLALAGLRSLYFLLEGMMAEFRFLQPALAVLLVIIGLKLVVEDFVHVPIYVSLLLVLVTIGTGVVTSIVLPGELVDQAHHELGDAAIEELEREAAPEEAAPPGLTEDPAGDPERTGPDRR